MRDGRQLGGRGKGGKGGHPSGRRHVWQDVSPGRIVLVVVVLVAEVLYRPFNNVCHKADTDSGQGRHRMCVCVCQTLSDCCCCCCCCRDKPFWNLYSQAIIHQR